MESALFGLLAGERVPLIVEGFSLSLSICPEPGWQQSFGPGAGVLDARSRELFKAELHPVEGGGGRKCCPGNITFCPLDLIPALVWPAVRAWDSRGRGHKSEGEREKQTELMFWGWGPGKRRHLSQL